MGGIPKEMVERNPSQESNNTIQAFWVAMGKFSSIALGIVSAMILSRYFDKTEYGTYRQIIYVYTTLLVIFSAGLPRVFAYFLPRYDLSEGKMVVTKINRVLFLTGVFFSLFLFAFSSLIADVLNNPELSRGLKVFSPIPLLLLPTLGIEGIFSTYKKTIYIAIYNTISRLLTLGFIVVPVIFFKGSYIFAIYGWVIASFLTFVLGYIFKGIPFKNVASVETSLKYKEVFAYSIPLVIASIWGIAINSANQFYISRYFGVETFAEFSNGFIELPFVGMVSSSAAVVLMPIFSKVIHKNNGLEELLKIWRSTLYLSSKIIYPILIFMLFFATEIMVIIYSDKYFQSGTYFRINMFLNFFNIILFAPLFLAMGKTKMYANVHLVLAIVIWTSDFVLVQLFDSPLLIAYNSTFLNILKIFYFVYLASNILKIKFIDFFPVKSMIKIIIHGVLIATLVKIIALIAFQNSYFSNVHLVLQIGFNALIYGGLLLATSSIFKIDYLAVAKPLFSRFKRKK